MVWRESKGRTRGGRKKLVFVCKIFVIINKIEKKIVPNAGTKAY